MNARNEWEIWGDSPYGGRIIEGFFVDRNVLIRSVNAAKSLERLPCTAELIGPPPVRRVGSLLADCAVDRFAQKVGVAGVTGRLLNKV